MSQPIVTVVDDLASQGARRFIAYGRESIARDDGFYVALCGGPDPVGMYRALQPTDLPWDAVDLFFGDERRVPPSSPYSNYNEVHEALLCRIPTARAHVLREAHEYEELLRVTLGESGRFDLVLLGMGENGHTASLFPGSPALAERERWVVEAPGGPPVPERLTITPPLIWKARHVLILVAGEQKAERLKEVLEGPPGRYPIQLVEHCEGTVEWLVDRAAASYLAR